MSKKITICLMDPPYENARTVTGLRLLHLGAQRGYDMTVFAYEGAVALPFEKQTPHANPVHGHDVEEEKHPLPKDWIAAIRASAKEHGGKLDWINCGLCEDERGVNESIEGVRRGTPGDLHAAAMNSDGTLIIATKG